MKTQEELQEQADFVRDSMKEDGIPMNNKQKSREKFERKLETILGGYCWSCDGGDGGYSFEDVLEFIDKALSQHTEDIVRKIKNWTKGKTVTKDKLRNYLNQIK